MNDWKTFFLSARHVQWIDFKKLFSWSYLSDSALSYSSPLVALLGYIFLALIIIGITLNIILGKKNKTMPIYAKIRGHLTNMTMWLGIIGLLLVVGRFQGIYLLSSRILMLLNLLALAIWSAWIVYYAVAKLPKMAQDYRRKQTKEKYLPKKKTVRL